VYTVQITRRRSSRRLW